MIPADSHKKIKSINIYRHQFDLERVGGFQFFDREHNTIFRIGVTYSSCLEKTVVLTDNEVIIGVKAKLIKEWRSSYSDFQF